MPLISVIVPVYNAEKTIKRCVDSIRRQTFSDVEILLIEDGAKDASGALCDSFAGEDARIRVLHKKKRRGIRCQEFGNGHGAGDLHPVYGQ